VSALHCFWTVQWPGERGDYVPGIEWRIDAGSAIHFMAKILVVADHVGGIFGDPPDWPDAGRGGVV
jgi:hypothetical protein